MGLSACNRAPPIDETELFGVKVQTILEILSSSIENQAVDEMVLKICNSYEKLVESSFTLMLCELDTSFISFVLIVVLYLIIQMMRPL